MLCCCCLTRGGRGRYLQPLDLLGLMVASLCHDLDHPGNTNKFEIDSEYGPPPCKASGLSGRELLSNSPLIVRSSRHSVRWYV